MIFFKYCNGFKLSQIIFQKIKFKKVDSKKSSQIMILLMQIMRD